VPEFAAAKRVFRFFDEAMNPEFICAIDHAHGGLPEIE